MKSLALQLKWIHEEDGKAEIKTTKRNVRPLDTVTSSVIPWEHRWRSGIVVATSIIHIRVLEHGEEPYRMKVKEQC